MRGEGMDFFDVLALAGGLALFLFGMNLMGTALEKRAGNKLKTILASITSNPIKGFLLGLAVTAVIQSSSATTVMVVGFVNSGLMNLHQAVGVIMGANLGTSVTSWILSLTGIEGESFWVQMLKPESFTPVLAFIGVVFYAFQKNAKRKDTGLILLGFAVLMYGMEMMSDAVYGLRSVPEFTSILTMFSNPILGVIVGTVFTAVIQSSSASVGILQALTATGGITYAVAVPVIMGQNIGTCVSALISSIGASKNARRAAMIHLYFNVIATLILLPLYYIIEHTIGFAFTYEAATPLGIAVVHTVFKLLALAMLMPCNKLLEKLAVLTVKDSKKDNEMPVLDERLMATPSVAIERCRNITVEMAELSFESVQMAFNQLKEFNTKSGERIRELENIVDKYEDMLGTYLVKLSSHSLREEDSAEVAKLLHIIGDLERISDHGVIFLDVVEEIEDKKLDFSDEAKAEQTVMISAVEKIMDLTMKSINGDTEAPKEVEPLDQVIDKLQNDLRARHIMRLQKSECTIELGFVLSDMLTSLERISGHCANVAGCIMEISQYSLGLHEHTHSLKGEDSGYAQSYAQYAAQFKL